MILNRYLLLIARSCKEISKGNFDIRTTVDFKGEFKEIVASINGIIKI
jgi:methyl-accepting chemotaxis protein